MGLWVRGARRVADQLLRPLRRALPGLIGPTEPERMLASLDAGLDRHAAALTGKGVLITGSTRGIGRALAEGFARCGATVIVHGRSEDDARQVAAALSERFRRKAVGIGADLRLPGAGRTLVARSLEAVGRLDVVVNNAAIHDPVRKPVWATSSREMEDLLRVNLLAPFEVAAAAVAGMRERRVRGRLVNISSAAAGYAPPGVASYSISKAALERLSEYLAMEAPELTVATLRPAPIDTDMVRSLFARGVRSRMLPPSSVVPAVLHLATAPRGQVHGQVFSQLELLRKLAADGGASDPRGRPRAGGPPLPGEAGGIDAAARPGADPVPLAEGAGRSETR